MLGFLIRSREYVHLVDIRLVLLVKMILRSAPISHLPRGAWFG